MMKKIFCIIGVLCFSIVNISGCVSSDPLLPGDVIEKIEENFGYTLAPTWLPEGYEFMGITTETASSSDEVVLPYSKLEGYDYRCTIAFMYPLSDYDESHLLAMFPELVKPENAVMDIKVNGNPAKLQYGTWTVETNRRIQHLETPLEPEWDYESGNSVRFEIAVSENETVGVLLRPLFGTCELTDDELIKIAGSLVVVER